MASNYAGLGESRCQKCLRSRETLAIRIEGVRHELCRHCVTTRNVRRSNT